MIWRSMNLLDHYLPDYQFQEVHTRQTRATPERLIDAAQAYRPEHDRFFRSMITLRELPMRLFDRTPRRAAFGLQDFTLLERQPEQLVYGLAGRFWQNDYGLESITDGATFRTFDRPGVPRLALGFMAKALGNGRCQLQTQTRVYCPDAASLRSFRPYWYLIRPVSGLIRQRMLKAIANAAENAA